MKSSSLTNKLIITVILGILGITYILYKPPKSQITSYQKQSMPKPYYTKESSDNNTSSENAGDSDAVSLMGKKGSYEETTIGKKK